ncbi:16S rRNA (guanine(527)-N(7))-methyltransferase RsmG [Caulobacter sp. S45]|uniref:16S rRNA (guanine(527)-N(7))-methyltransferase RsmG n=1 Tax=Caulobacter sp. S45 TaxID=1641861 RepID=UPI00131D8EFC|nr:16S rRNA (guanine(527)-N(7))-methyltransferase RsmG [Caulobacter sp. S45]
MFDAVSEPLESAAPAFGAEAFAQATEATSGQMADLERFRALLDVQNAHMNLVGPSALAGFWLRHAYDSAQLLHVEPLALRWADVGAGAGFPGIVLAILLKGKEGARVHLIESMGKRVRFLSEVCEALALPADIHHGRAEEISTPTALEVVTARACAPLPRLLGYTEHLFRGGAKGVFLKGQNIESELTEARQNWKFHAELLSSQSDPSGRIVRIERLSRA